MSEEIKVKQIKCPNCGATAQTEICPYCGSRTGIDTAEAELEYPEFEGVDVTENYAKDFLFFGAFWELIVLTLFGAFKSIGEDFGFFFNHVFFSIFNVLGIVFLGIGIYLLTRRMSVMTRGETVKGICYGYTKDRVKVLLPTEDGPKYLFFRRRKAYRQFVVNDTVRFSILENRFVVLDEEI